MESLEAVSLGRRLDQLERAHRRLKRAVAGWLIALAAIGVMGQATVTRLKTVEADWLVIHDAARNAQAPFGLTGWRVVNSKTQTQPYLDVSQSTAEFSADSVGKERVGFHVGPDGGVFFALSDSTRRRRVVSLVTPDDRSSQITLSDSAGKSRAVLSEGFGLSPSLILSDSAGKMRASLAAEGLTLFDEAGRIRAVLGETDWSEPSTILGCPPPAGRREDANGVRLGRAS